MIEFGGIIYQLDLDALNEAIKIKGQNSKDIVERVEKTYTNEKGEVTGGEILETFRGRFPLLDSNKYEIIRMLIDILMDDVDEEPDDSLGIERALSKKPVSYRIAFNTLKNYKILKEI